MPATIATGRTAFRNDWLEQRVLGAASAREWRRVPVRPRGMNLTILILIALGTTLPCLFLWAADQRELHRVPQDA